MELIIKAYYYMIDEAEGNSAWVRKIEDDIGQQIHYMYLTYDESVRDALVAKSDLFRRFVRHIIFC